MLPIQVYEKSIEIADQLQYFKVYWLRNSQININLKIQVAQKLETSFFFFFQSTSKHLVIKLWKTTIRGWSLNGHSERKEMTIRLTADL